MIPDYIRTGIENAKTDKERKTKQAFLNAYLRQIEIEQTADLELLRNEKIIISKASKNKKAKKHIEFLAKLNTLPYLAEILKKEKLLILKELSFLV